MDSPLVDFPFAVTATVERPLATIVHPRFDPETLAHDLAAQRLGAPADRGFLMRYLHAR